MNDEVTYRVIELKNAMIDGGPLSYREKLSLQAEWLVEHWAAFATCVGSSLEMDAIAAHQALAAALTAKANDRIANALEQIADSLAVLAGRL